MFWKNGRTEAEQLPRGAYSITRRLIIFNIVAALVILLTTIGYLYYALVRSLEDEDRFYLIKKIQAVRTVLREQPDRPDGVQREVELQGEFQFIRFYIRVLDERGAVVARTTRALFTPPADAFPEPTPADMLPEKGRKKRFAEGQSYYFMSARADDGKPGGRQWIIQAALDVSHEASILRRYRIRVEMVLWGGIFICGALGFWIARRSMRPMRMITRTLRRVHATKLDERLDATQLPQELTVFAASFNDMLDRLEDSFNRLNRFSTDLAHELRTPINNLRGEAEVALSKARTAEEYRQIIESSIEEYEHLSHMIESLLFIAKAESTDIAIQRAEFSAEKETLAVLDYYDAYIDEKKITISLNGSAVLHADPVLFRRIMTNVLSNAFRYTPAGGRVTISMWQSSLEETTITITDTGVGIAAEDIDHIFSRFYRGKAAKKLVSSGTGLGLAIVKSIMDLHGGRIKIASTPAAGTTVTLTFPAPAKITKM
jgi:two-component system heavy metal sensor histidine kinase CusS